MSERRRMIGPVATVTGVLGILLGLRPIGTERLLAGYVLALGALVLLALARDVRSADASEDARRFEAALRRRPRGAAIPVELRRTGDLLTLGSASAEYAHRRLLPLLRTAAAARLASRHAIDLGRSPDTARALLGDDAWELLRPDRAEPDDRHGPGIPRAEIAAVIERVEAL